MSDRIALELSGVSKMYKVFATRRQRVLDAIGFGRLFPGKIEARMFWSLRDVDLTVKAGSRLGIIGRNGAGKSTMLKLITGALAPTEGRIQVNGQVQALFEAGSGFHPEFTGVENIHAALTYQGLTVAEIEAAIADIAEFTELDEFLRQPLKTYSLGMQARLAFATATVVRPDILIVDEVLGAGDAYFVTKSSDRMRRLVDESGATVLIVSHALDQVLRYCDECLWLERGRVVQRGPALDVVNAYEAFIRDMEDKRLRGKNRSRRRARDVPGAETHDRFRVRCEWRGEKGTSCAVNEIALEKDGRPIEVLKVGDVQDADTTHLAALVLARESWSEPRRAEVGFFRELELPVSAGSSAGLALFKVHGAAEAGEYSVRLRCKMRGTGSLRLTVEHNEEPLIRSVEVPLPPDAGSAWVESTVPVGRIRDPDGGGDDQPHVEEHSSSIAGPTTRAIYRWPSEGSLRIERVRVLGDDGRPRAVFQAGTTLQLVFDLEAKKAGTFNVISGATLYRLDGVYVTNLISPVMPMHLESGASRTVRLELRPLNLGDATYVFSLSTFEKAITEENRYDLIARCIEFQVVGNSPLIRDALFVHAASWSAEGAAAQPAGAQEAVGRIE